jgi:hypothetical protein
MFCEGCNHFLSVFGREDPFLRVRVLTEPEFVKVADGPSEKAPRTLPRVIVPVALSTMRPNLRKGTAREVQGAHLRFASEHLGALAPSALGSY